MIGFSDYHKFCIEDILNIELAKKDYWKTAELPQGKNFELKRTLGRRDSRFFYIFKIVTDCMNFCETE